MESDQVIQTLAALAHPVRLQVFRALVVQGPEGLTPSVVSEALGIPANSLSFHLRELLHAGLVTQQRAGRYIVYRASFTHMAQVLKYLTDNCCQGAGCVLSQTADAACERFAAGPAVLAGHSAHAPTRRRGRVLAS